VDVSSRASSPFVLSVCVCHWEVWLPLEMTMSCECSAHIVT
jgi:hypothetical protein